VERLSTLGELVARLRELLRDVDITYSEGRARIVVMRKGFEMDITVECKSEESCRWLRRVITLIELL